MSEQRARPLAHDLPAIARAAAHYPTFDANSLRVYLLLRRVISRADKSADAHFARHGISQARFLVLINLYKTEGHGLTPAVLADLLNVTRATITGLLDTLERDAMVAREPDPDDRRSVLVRLSLTGRRFLEAMMPDHFARIAGVLRDFSGLEREQLEHLLQKVFDGLNAFELPEPPVVQRTAPADCPEFD
jgi:DNA-binding MarR family transcriptional regulator